MSRATLLLPLFSLVLIAAVPAAAQTDELPAWLKDRGTGIPTSMFGTYVTRHQLLIYPFFEYYLDDNLEYKPDELGYNLDEDFRGKYRASEYLLFASYGITGWLMVELEASYHIDASLETSPDDPSGDPAKVEESGTGDVEGQLRARLMRETESRPELFAYFEAVSPQQQDKVLIGTPDWEYALGAGVIRGFSWGTMTFRIAAEYSVEEDKTDIGEYALEYLKRVNPKWRLYLGMEGSQDELSVIPEVQWHIRTDRIIVKLNSGFGVTSKATDWAPEVGVVFALGGK